MSPTNNPSLSTRAGIHAFLGKAFYGASFALWALLPLHAFLVTWLKFGLHVPGPLSAWKEGLLLVLGVVATIGYLLDPRKVKLDRLDVAILAFFAIGVLSSVLQYLQLGHAAFVRIAYGFKYDFLILAVFLLFRHHSFDLRSLSDRVGKTIMGVGLAVCVFAILLCTVLPHDLLKAFGYTPAFGTWNVDGPLAIYQALDPRHPEIPRASGTFAGPNQFAMYALIVIGLSGAALARVKKERMDKKILVLYSLALVFGIVGTVLSYSRSALVGLLAASGTALLFGVGLGRLGRMISGAKRTLSIGLLAVAIIIGSVFMFVPATSSYLRSIFIRESSTQGHYERSRDGVLRTLKYPLLGEGIGEAGPASARVDPRGLGFMPENWYLQISVQYGIPGLIAWLAILFLMAMALYERTKLPASRFQPTALLFSFIAINVACLFLHAWEDSAVAITWWGLAGLALSSTSTPR